jgi:hypothetical protein
MTTLGIVLSVISGLIGGWIVRSFSRRFSDKVGPTAESLNSELNAAEQHLHKARELANAQ